MRSYRSLRNAAWYVLTGRARQGNVINAMLDNKLGLAQHDKLWFSVKMQASLKDFISMLLTI